MYTTECVLRYDRITALRRILSRFILPQDHFLIPRYLDENSIVTANLRIIKRKLCFLDNRLLLIQIKYISKSIFRMQGFFSSSRSFFALILQYTKTSIKKLAKFRIVLKIWQS